jgi:hypothetical protein
VVGIFLTLAISLDRLLAIRQANAAIAQRKRA